MPDSEVVVASQIYNLAGPEADRPNYLKSLIMGGLSRNSKDMGNVITSGYLNGPGLRYRRFARWARTNEDVQASLGITNGNLQPYRNIDQAVVKANISVGVGESVDVVETAKIEPADINYWVLHYLAKKYPGETFNYSYKYDWNTGIVTITYDDATTEVFNATVVGPYIDTPFVADAEYLYVRYIPGVNVPSPPPPVFDSPITLPDGEDFPSRDGWVYDSQTLGAITLNLGYRERTRITYDPFLTPSDTTNTKTRATSVDVYTQTFYRDSFRGASGAWSNATIYAEFTIVSHSGKYWKSLQNSNSNKEPGVVGSELWWELSYANAVHSMRDWMKIDMSYTVGDWVAHDNQLVGISSFVLFGTTYTQTTRTDREVQRAKPLRKVQYAATPVLKKAWDHPRWFIYRKDSVGGSPLNALFNAPATYSAGEFFPVIPFRYRNKTVGPLELQATFWWVNIGMDDMLNPVHVDKTHEIYIFGGSISKADSFRLDFTQVDPADSKRYVAHSYLHNAADVLQPIAEVLSRQNAQWWIKYPDPNSSGDILETEPAPFPVVSEPTAAQPVSYDQAMADIYPICKKAFKKGFGVEFNQVQSLISENPDIGEVDHVYAIHGVSLNVQENACRKYLYKFFKYLMNSTPNYSTSDKATFFNQWALAKSSEDAWLAWRLTQVFGANAPYAEPIRHPFPNIPHHTLKIEAVHPGVLNIPLWWDFGTSNYRTEIQWAFVHEETGAGLQSGHETGDLWFELLPDPLVTGWERYYDILNQIGFNQEFAIWWQETPTFWRKLVITGLIHRNYVYQNHIVLTTAKSAFQQISVGFPPVLTDPPESPFIIPLHEGIFYSQHPLKMKLTDITQMSTASCYLVFNCYKIHQQEWYDDTWFKVVIIIAIVAASIAMAIYTGGGSLGFGGATIVSLLTTAGLAPWLAIALAAVVNALAGLLLAWLIGQASTALFGDKWGPLVGAIVTTIATMGLAAGPGFLELLSKPEGWMPIIMATGAGAAKTMEVQAQELADSTAKMMEAYGAKNAEIARMSAEEFGSGIDLSLVSKYIDETTERPENFLQRTLMTGSDIVEVTLRAIERFTDDNLRLELPR